MGLMDEFSLAIDYIEQNLESEIDYEKIAGFFGYSLYHAQRLFAMVCGTPLAEYIRNRKLSKAATELQGGKEKVIDLAIKYGYSSTNSFSHAFKAFHGVLPSDVKKSGVSIKAYPPLLFELTVKGAQAMEYRIEQKPAFRVVGAKLSTTMANGECYQATPAFWAELMQRDGQKEIIALLNGEPAGLLGVSNYSVDFSTGNFDYYIACASDQPVSDGLEEFIVPSAMWAIFPCKEKGADGIQNMEQRIVMEWLPSSGYELAKAPDVELYSVTGLEEVWIPITK